VDALFEASAAIATAVLALGGSLPALDSRPALRALLDRHWSTPRVSTGTRFPTFIVRQGLSRFAAGANLRPSHPVRAWRGAFQRSSPLRRISVREPTHAGIAVPRLPSARPGFLTLSTPSRFPGRSRACFIPDPPVGFHPSRLSPFAEPQHLSVSVAFLAFSRRCPRPTVHPPRGDEHRAGRVTRAFPHGRTSAVGAAPAEPLAASVVRFDPTIPRGTAPGDSRSDAASSATVAVRRMPASSPSRLFSLQRARSPRPVVTPHRGRCLPGLHLFRALSRRAGIGISLPSVPLGL